MIQGLSETVNIEDYLKYLDMKDVLKMTDCELFAFLINKSYQDVLKEKLSYSDYLYFIKGGRIKELKEKYEDLY